MWCYFIKWNYYIFLYLYITIKQMTRSEFKTLKINPELHNKLKSYCNDNGLKLNIWVEKQLEKIIDLINEKT